MNRRRLLQLLGVTAVGTLAHEQLSWLARQPVSVSGLILEPHTVSMPVVNLKPEDQVLIFHGPEPVIRSWSGGIEVHRSRSV